MPTPPRRRPADGPGAQREPADAGSDTVPRRIAATTRRWCEPSGGRMSIRATVSSAIRSPERRRPWCLRVTCGRKSARRWPVSTPARCRASRAFLAKPRQLAAVAHERDRHIAATAEHRLLAGGGAHDGGIGGRSSNRVGDDAGRLLSGEGLDERDVQRPVGHGELITSGERNEREHDDEARHPASLTGWRAASKRLEMRVGAPRQRASSPCGSSSRPSTRSIAAGA